MGRKIVVKTTQKVDKNKPTSAPIPEKNKSAGIKEKIEKRAKQIKIKKAPKRLRSMEETWDTVEPLDENFKEVLGLKFLIYGPEKSGKSHLSQDILNFEEYEGRTRIIPCGSPVYVLDTEVGRAYEVAKQKFREHLLDGTLKVKQCNVKDPVTKKTDKANSLRILTDFALSVLEEEQGTLIIDTVTDFGDWLYSVLVTEVLGDEYGFDEWGAEIKKVAPVQYAWKRKENVDILRALRDTKLNVILLGQARDEYEKPKKNKKGKANMFDNKPTGAIIADVDKKTGHWVDVICLLEKDKQTGKRKITITDSAFEEKVAKMIEITDDVTISGIVNALKDKL
jgi:hypothetical protein